MCVYSIIQLSKRLQMAFFFFYKKKKKYEFLVKCMDSF